MVKSKAHEIERKKQTRKDLQEPEECEVIEKKAPSRRASAQKQLDALKSGREKRCKNILNKKESTEEKPKKPRARKQMIIVEDSSSTEEESSSSEDEIIVKRVSRKAKAKAKPKEQNEPEVIVEDKPVASNRLQSPPLGVEV